MYIYYSIFKIKFRLVPIPYNRKLLLLLRVEGINISFFVSGHFSLLPNLLNILEECLNLYFKANVRAQDHFKACAKLSRDLRLLANE